MQPLTKELLDTLPKNTRIKNIKAVYRRNGQDMYWTSHDTVINKQDFSQLKQELSQDKSGLRWLGKII